MAVQMNLKLITKNHAADPEIGFLAKSISKSNGCATAMPTAWELVKIYLFIVPCYTEDFLYSKILYAVDGKRLKF